MLVLKRGKDKKSDDPFTLRNLDAYMQTKGYKISKGTLYTNIYSKIKNLRSNIQKEEWIDKWIKKQKWINTNTGEEYDKESI